jgi:hypothetical protein
MNDPLTVSDNGGEWFELYNPTGRAIDIEGWTITDNGADSHIVDNSAPLLILANGYLLLGNNPDFGTNGGVTLNYAYGADIFLSNSADAIHLLDSLSVLIDGVDYSAAGGFPHVPGASMSLEPSAPANDDAAKWCRSSTQFGDGDFGTPGLANECH